MPIGSGQRSGGERGATDVEDRGGENSSRFQKW